MADQPSVVDTMVEDAVVRDLASVNQSWELTGVYMTPAGTRLRVQIRRNAYDAQSYGQVEAWSPTDLRWNQVYYLPAPRLSVCAKTGSGFGQDLVSYVQRRLSEAASDAFADDEATLLAIALQVLGEGA